MSIARPKRRRWTLEEYDRMADLGLFQGQRVELIGGEIIQMPPRKNEHAIATGLAEEAGEAAFGPDVWIRIQMPLHLQGFSAPEPDLAVVPGRPRDYAKTGHPTTALLVVEISDTTLPFDRRFKASLYATAGIADYWIVNLDDRQLEVYRSPAADPRQKYGFGYADRSILDVDEYALPLAAPAARIAVGDLLP